MAPALDALDGFVVPVVEFGEGVGGREVVVGLGWGEHGLGGDGVWWAVEKGGK